MTTDDSTIKIMSRLVATPSSGSGSGQRLQAHTLAGEASPGATSAPEIPTSITLILRNAPYQRHEKQLINQAPDLVPIVTPEFPQATLGEEIAINDRYRHFKIAASVDGIDRPITALRAVDGKPLIQELVYLFNVIVALEWLPSLTTIQQLMNAFRSASDFLYDCTNGSMAIGQVIFTGRDLIDRADIQIMASNRFHPRSLVNALNEPDKFSPIRLGRGLWSKNNSVLIPWDEPVAYRTIVHEWGHYALSLHDEYIDEAKKVKKSKSKPYRLVDTDEEKDAQKTLVVPSYSVSLESIMATIDSSEIAPKQRKTIDGDPLRQHLLNKFEGLYPGVSAALIGPANPGPDRLPLPLPQFYSTFDTRSNDYKYKCEERDLDVNNLKISGKPVQHCWLYLLRRNNQTYLFEQIVAQGTIDARARDQTRDEGTVKGLDFQLLGDRSCNEVLAIGYAQMNNSGDSALFVRRALLDGAPPDWKADSASEVLPVVTVIPINRGDLVWPKVIVKVRVLGGTPPTNAWIVPPGKDPKKLGRNQERSYWESEFVELEELDGLVVLQYGNDMGATFWVCEYSHGGNPPTSIRKLPAPVSAGSSDGNLMLFCRTTEDSTQFASKRVVTTRNYATFCKGSPGQPPNFYQFDPHMQAYTSLSGLPGKPASYLFSVASNEDLSSDRLLPTIIMYFDINSLEDEGDPIIHRYDFQEGTWKPLLTYSPRGGFYAAIPLDKESGPTLVDPNERQGDRVEYYQLFLV